MFGVTGHMSIWFKFLESVLASTYVAENGATVYVAEDGVSPYVPES